MTVLNRKLITRMVNPQPGGNGGGGGYVPQSQDVSWTDINGKPTTLSGYGITDAYWATTQSTSDKRNLTIGSVTQQVITAHQSLSGYATEYWVGQQGYATQTWVGNNYLPLAGGAMASGARISFSGSNGYIGNADNSGWLMVQDICSQNGAGDTYWSLRTNGNAHFANVYSAGYVTALSDARKKRVLGDIVLSAEQIAQMPAVRFEWKDPEKPGMFIGTLAQNWREILPESVHTLDDGTLSFDYQSAAIVALINLADEIVSIKNKLNRYGFK